MIKLNQLKLIICFILSFVFGYLHFLHLQNLFENDKHFSHLSTLERELSFRTESGLYYYYFKQLVLEKNLNKNIFTLINRVIINDTRTEYPLSINSLQRFNLYPEIILANLYRFMNNKNLLKKECWNINRGDDLPPVESCVGQKEPIYFYTNSVFLLHAFTLAFLFIFCWLLNDKSLLSGIIGCLCYFYNHSEATRVMWTPALRESFAFPFHLLQLIALTLFIRSNNLTKFNQLFLVLTTLIFLITWQFAQFSLATQLGCLFLVFSLGFISKHKFIIYLKSLSLSLLACYILMFFNRMLLTSLLSSLISSIWLIIFIENFFTFINETNNLAKKIFLFIQRIFLLIISMFLFKLYVVKILLNNKEDDSHIWDILKSKIDTNLHTFDTRLYTCAKEFDFLELNTIYKLNSTLLLPIAGFNFIFLSILIIRNFFFSSNLIDNFKNGLILYNLLQLIAYSIMAFMIMRLKLFLTPYLCVIASIVANLDTEFNFFYIVVNKIKLKYKRIDKSLIYALVFLLIGLMSYQGYENLKEQYSIQGEYNDYAQESLMNWILKNTKLNDAFVGSMPLMANVKLSTNRPIINHPHYEDVGLRIRIKTIYSHLYGYRPLKELYSILKQDYKAKYLIIERHYCLSNPPNKPECGMGKISDLALNRTTNKQACDLILQQTEQSRDYFLKVFSYSYLNVFKIL